MPDMQQLMQQAAQMQAEVQRRQAELAEATFEGTAGGGVVTAVVRGSGELVSVTIDPAVLDPDDPEMVGDLVVAAVNQALKGIQEAAAETMPALPDLGELGGLGDLGGLLG
jgi:DNA-binding YbaB/EbfC family protein